MRMSPIETGMQHGRYPPADGLDDTELLHEFRDMLGGPLATRSDPPEAKPGEVWLRRSWLVSAHRDARQLLGETGHLVYYQVSDEELMGSLSEKLGFGLNHVAQSDDWRVEVETIYCHLRALKEESENDPGW
jgi:hypothetical protein